MIRNRVICQILTKEKINKGRLKKLAGALFNFFKNNRAVKHAHPESSEYDSLTIAFVSRARSRRLNKAYRKKDDATDVLSFSQEARGHGLGELVLCGPVLRKQAKENGHSFEKEVDLMVIHGFLHLLGYDHEKSRKEELKMLKLQDKLFKKLSR